MLNIIIDYQVKLFEHDVVFAFRPGNPRHSHGANPSFVYVPLLLHTSFAEFMLWLVRTDSSLVRCIGHHAFHYNRATNISHYHVLVRKRSPTRLGEVLADNLNRLMYFHKLYSITLLLVNLLYLVCDLLQTLVFTIAILQSARYSPMDQGVFYWVARVEYTSLGILAIWDLLYCLWPPYESRLAFQAISVSMSMIHVVLTIILLAASICLRMKSNPARDEHKVRTICFERYISTSCERIIWKESSDSTCSTGTELVSGRYNGSLRPERCSFSTLHPP